MPIRKIAMALTGKQIHRGSWQQSRSGHEEAMLGVEDSSRPRPRWSTSQLLLRPRASDFTGGKHRARERKRCSFGLWLFGGRDKDYIVSRSRHRGIAPSRFFCLFEEQEIQSFFTAYSLHLKLLVILTFLNTLVFTLDLETNIYI
jgi:hypothetical protein